MRGRLIFPFLAELRRLDTAAMASTGSSSPSSRSLVGSAPRGVNTLAVRQSSEKVSSGGMLGHMPRPPSCWHGGPASVAFRTFVHAGCGCGLANRSAPSGGAA